MRCQTLAAARHRRRGWRASRPDIGRAIGSRVQRRRAPLQVAGLGFAAQQQHAALPGQFPVYGGAGNARADDDEVVVVHGFRFSNEALAVAMGSCSGQRPSPLDEVLIFVRRHEGPPVVHTRCVARARCCCRPCSASQARPESLPVSMAGPPKPAAAEGSMLARGVQHRAPADETACRHATVKQPESNDSISSAAGSEARGTARPSARSGWRGPSRTPRDAPRPAIICSMKQGDCTGSAKKQCTCGPSTWRRPKVMPAGAPPTPQGR